MDLNVTSNEPTSWKSDQINYRLIAKLSGVGKSTVGRVLHGGGKVSASTREKVLKTAEKLGYRPDPALGALSRRRWPGGAKPRTATIAYLDTSHPRKDGPQVAQELLGIKDRVAQLGYSLDVFRPRDYAVPGSVSRVMFARGIQGVIIRAFREGSELDLDWPRFHAVFVGPENDVPRVHNVQGDFRTALHLAASIAVERGYRRLGFLLMNYLASGTNVPFHAQALYEQEGLSKKVGPQPDLFFFDPGDKVGLGFRSWLRRHRPDVIISTNTQPFYWLTQPSEGSRASKAIRVPEDIAMVCLRSTPDVPGLAHFSLREYEQGVKAVDLLHQHLQHGIIGQPSIPLRLLVPPVFIDGFSLPGCF